MNFLLWALVLLVLAVAIQLSEAGNRDECVNAPSQCPAGIETECVSCGCRCPWDHPNCKEFCLVYNYDTIGNQLACNQTAHRCEKKDVSGAAMVTVVLSIAIPVCCCACVTCIYIHCCRYRLREMILRGRMSQIHASGGAPYQPGTQSVQYSGNVQIQQPAHMPGVGYAASPQVVQCTVVGVVPASAQGVIMQAGGHQLGVQQGIVVQGTVVQQNPVPMTMVQRPMKW